MGEGIRGHPGGLVFVPSNTYSNEFQVSACGRCGQRSRVGVRRSSASVIVVAHGAHADERVQQDAGRSGTAVDGSRSRAYALPDAVPCSNRCICVTCCGGWGRDRLDDRRPSRTDIRKQRASRRRRSPTTARSPIRMRRGDPRSGTTRPAPDRRGASGHRHRQRGALRLRGWNVGAVTHPIADCRSS